MPSASLWTTVREMQSYGVVWRIGHGPLSSGKLELRARGLHFDGMQGSTPTSLDLDFPDVSGVRVARTTADRIGGRPSVVVDRGTAEPVAISGVAEPGLASELAERIAAFRSDGEDRPTVVVLPLRAGAHGRVRALLADGPPFDPEEIGLARHQVFVTEREVVFVFEFASGAGAVETVLSSPGFVETAVAWQDLLAGPPRVAGSAYSWAGGASGSGGV